MGSSRRRSSGSWKARLILAAIIAGISLVTYFTANSTNPITGEDERTRMTYEEEVVLGLQAMDGVADQFGGVDRNEADQRRLQRIGEEVLAAAKRLYPEGQWDVYRFSFTLLADDRTVNAFALPGGPTFMTRALYEQCDDAMLMAVMGHEVGHVIHRHGAERIEKQKLWQGLSAAAATATGDMTGAQAAAMVTGMLSAGYSRDDERESDTQGYDIMIQAGYDPRAMVDLMEVLAASSGGGGGQPSVLATHPDPGERADTVRRRIEQDFPNGIPADLTRGEPTQ